MSVPCLKNMGNIYDLFLLIYLNLKDLKDILRILIYIDIRYVLVLETQQLIVQFKWHDLITFFDINVVPSYNNICKLVSQDVGLRMWDVQLEKKLNCKVFI